MQFGLSEDIIKGIQSVFENNSKVDKVFIFGSRAKGNYRPGSDIDLAIKGTEITEKDILNLHIKLSELDIPYKVDLLNYHTIKEPELKDHIDRVGIEFYSRWKEYTLGEITHKITDGAHLSPKDFPNGRVMFSVKDMTETGFDYTKPKTISQEDFDNLVKQGCQPDIDDVLIAKDGSVLKHIFRVTTKPDYVLLSSIAIVKPKKEFVDSFFLVYTLKNPKITETILNNFVSGSGVPRIVLKDFKKVIVSLPPLNEQRAISSILNSLDNKIDLLHRQNKTLEQLAETLFRQWFVEEADESWEEVSLYDCIELVGGGTPKTENHSFWIGEIPWLSGGDIAACHKSFITKSEKCISENGLNNSSTKLLPKFATVITARGTVGKYCILSKPMTFSQSNYGILPKIDNCYFFTYLLIAHSVDELLTAAYGSVFDTITTKTFKEQKVQIPNTEQIIKFEEEVVVYFKKILNNQIQIDELSKMRNVLLPKLMSGEVRVKMSETELTE